MIALRSDLKMVLAARPVDFRKSVTRAGVSLKSASDLAGASAKNTKMRCLRDSSETNGIGVPGIPNVCRSSA